MSYGSDAKPNAQTSELFKGIALFTPAGDLIYCIDPYKQNRWHLQLCTALQEMLGLPEPPHFLVPCYTATIDRWINPRTQQIETAAEACPFVLRHQAVLNAIFATGNLTWKPAPIREGMCDPLVLSTYQSKFPQLWEEHDLVLRFESVEPHETPALRGASNLTLSSQEQPAIEQGGYVLRLYVAGSNSLTEHLLQTLHRLLEEAIQQPYTLKIVDIYKNPEQAEMDQIAATPTLIKVWPHPVKRIVGDLDNIGQILQVLKSS